jgi:hypothetical protein
MSASDTGRLSDSVWGMDVDVNMCLAGELAPSALVPRIMETCRRIRAQPIDDETEYAVQALEQLAQEFSLPLARAYARQRTALLGPDQSQLLNEIFLIRMRLNKKRGSARD